jgi:pimeloyl-ACP methyl ester carboxylesterase
MESKDADRSRITLRDHVDAVVEAVDACDPAGGKVVLVEHSAGCGTDHAAADARPDRVARAVHIGGFPTGDGLALVDGFPVEKGEVPLPAWSDFEEGDLVDLPTGHWPQFTRPKELVQAILRAATPAS